MIFAGLDEAGRGALAGPVVAAAIIADKKLQSISPFYWKVIKDSKCLSEKKREAIFFALAPQIHFGIGIASPAEIDKEGIRKSTFLAMQRALRASRAPFDYLLIDGKDYFPFTTPHRFIVKGDAKIPLIGLASIFAKVVRDRLMMFYHQKFPDFDFSSHKGYGTKSHLRILATGKYAPIHRKSFAPLRTHHLPAKNALFNL